MMYVVDLPAWEFLQALHDWSSGIREAATRLADGGLVPLMGGPGDGVRDRFSLVRGGDAVFWMDVVAPCEGGLLVDIGDHAGVMHGIRTCAPGAYVEMAPHGRDLEGSRIAGPVPVVDGGVLFESLCGKVANAMNLQALGIKAERAEGGRYRMFPNDVDVVTPLCRYSFSVKEIEEELSRRGAPALANYSYDDLYDACTRCSDLADNVPGDRVLGVLCDCLDKTVDAREMDLAERARRNAFLPAEVRDCLAREQSLVSESDTLRGLRRSRAAGGVVVGCADGMDVVVKERPEGKEELGNRRYIAFYSGGKAVSLLNAVRDDYAGKPWDTVAKVFETAQRRSENLRRLERFTAKVGLGKKKDKRL